MADPKRRKPIAHAVLAASLGGISTSPAQTLVPAAKQADQRPITGSQPVTFQADAVSYDKQNGIVTATGHVEAWQNGHYMRADRVTFDRNTDVAAASGHVVIVEPDGQVIFADYAEMTNGMKSGVLSGMRALLANGGKLAANGARRTEGKLNEMARAVYSACNVCALNPKAPLTWQLRADHMTQDLEHKRIEFTDAWLDIYGVPVLYMPYFTSSDPSVKRQSGFLVPAFGLHDDYLGSFFRIPYYWVLDGQSDLTITPTLSSQQGGQLELDYERDFNAGKLSFDGAIAHDEGSLAGFIFGNANFDWNDTWRYGTSLNLGSSVNYLRDYQIEGFLGNALPSNAYIEGFGVGAYAKLDMLAWQGLNSSVNQSQLPYVLPRFQYDFFGEPDALGGRTSFSTQSFNVARNSGSNDQQIGMRLQWDRPFQGLLGEQYLLTAQVEASAFQGTVLNEQPNYLPVAQAQGGHALPQVAVKMNWPFLRDAGSLGSQILEPIVQVIGAPNTGNSLRDHLLNEDSLFYEFTDASLFSLNRFGGYDRFDGGLRVNAALHGNWTFRGGQVLDALVGDSWVEHIDRNLYPQFQPWNGFEPGAHFSDIVARTSFVPNNWLSFTTRGRIDPRQGDVRFADAITSFGKPLLHLDIGYLYGSYNPYLLYLFGPNFLTPGFLSPRNPAAASYFVPRNEATVALSSHYGHWTLSANGRRDLSTNQMIAFGGDLKYEDECTIFDILFDRRYTSINGDHGNTTVLFTIDLKTVGQIPING